MLVVASACYIYIIIAKSKDTDHVIKTINWSINACYKIAYLLAVVGIEKRKSQTFAGKYQQLVSCVLEQCFCSLFLYSVKYSYSKVERGTSTTRENQELIMGKQN